MQRRMQLHMYILPLTKTSTKHKYFGKKAANVVTSNNLCKCTRLRNKFTYKHTYTYNI